MARSVSLILIAVTIAGMVHAGDEPTADARQFDAQFRPLLVSHCATCHSGEKPKGNLRLDQLTSDFADAATREHWAAVVERLKAGEMPPKGKPRPPEKDVQALTRLDGPARGRRRCRRAGGSGRVVLRRLNRVEYENTVRDLLGIEVELKDLLPEDGSADGFDNVGAALHTSSFLMEKYLEAADTALNLAIANRPKPPPSIKKRYSLKDGHPVKASDRERLSLPGRRRVVCFCSSAWHNVGVDPVLPAGPRQLSLPHLRLRLSERRQAGHLSRDGAGTRLTGKSGLVGYFDAPPDKPTVVRVRRYMEPRTTITILPYGLAGREHGEQGRGREVRRAGAGGPVGRGRRAAARRPGRRRAIAASSATWRRRPSPIYNYSDRVEVVSDQPAGRRRADPPRLRPPGVPPRGDRRRRQAVRRPRQGQAGREVLVRAGGPRRPEGRAGVAGVPVPPREARQARRLRPGLPAVVLPLEHDARRRAAHARRAAEAEPARRAPPAGRADAASTRRRRRSPRTSSASGSACARSTPPSRATSSTPNSTTC